MRCGYSVLLLPLFGCDPTSGFADTAGAALPTIKRYFDGPGQRVADGPWHRVVVDLDADTLYHVGARRVDDEEPTFHLFGADAKDGCSVTPNVATWLMGKPTAAPYRVLPYLESSDERGRGRLRFTTLDCEVQDLAVEGAGRPYPRLYDRGYLVPTGQGYTFADPWSGEARVVAETVHRVLAWESPALLWADGKLKSFSDQFEEGAELGQNVAAVVQLNAHFLIEDDAGLQRVSFDRESLALGSEPVLPGACHLQRSPSSWSNRDGVWLAMEMPCGNPKPSLVQIDEEVNVVQQHQLDFEADARQSRALGILGDDEGGPAPLTTLYLTDVAEDGRGTLWAWREGAPAPIQLGERAELDSVIASLPSTGWDGLARINYQQVGSYTVFDWVHFRWSGETELIAANVLQSSSSGRVLVNFDGVAGDVPQFDEDGLHVVAEDVPPNVDDALSYIGARRYARVDRFDGDSGRLLLTDPERSLGFEELGSGVTPDGARFSWFMPALVFLEGWDSERKTGSLVAYNYELEARSTIAEGVSSFDLTSYPWDGIIYTVPYGRERGLWFSRAK
jgi:hypothetical protein